MHVCVYARLNLFLNWNSFPSCRRVHNQNAFIDLASKLKVDLKRCLSSFNLTSTAKSVAENCLRNESHHDKLKTEDITALFASSHWSKLISSMETNAKNSSSWLSVVEDCFPSVDSPSGPLLPHRRLHSVPRSVGSVVPTVPSVNTATIPLMATVHRGASYRAHPIDNIHTRLRNISLRSYKFPSRYQIPIMEQWIFPLETGK